MKANEFPASAPFEIYTSLLAHELSSPVTSILECLDELLKTEATHDHDNLHDAHQRMQRYAGEVARVVWELTTFTDAATESARARVAAPNADVGSLVMDIAAGRPVRLDTDSNVASVHVDVQRLRIVLEQLMEHAYANSPPGTRVPVRVSVDHYANRLMVRVFIGAESRVDALRAALFADSSPDKEPSAARPRRLGLGLTVAQRAAEGAGGQLVLDEELPTSLRLELPILEDPAIAQTRSLEERAALADVQALRAIRDFKTLRSKVEGEQEARRMAEAQQLRAVHDMRRVRKSAAVQTQQLDDAYQETLIAMASAIEARDNYSRAHIERVRRHAVRVGEELGLKGADLRQLGFGAIAHDIGKVALPDSIFRNGSLNEAQWDLVRQHPLVGWRMLEGVETLHDARDAVGAHHERWDGDGYPRHLAGEAIPLMGRIVAVADAFDAMITERHYRAKMTPAQAFATLMEARGTQFDPKVVDVFVACFAPPA